MLLWLHYIICEQVPAGWLVITHSRGTQYMITHMKEVPIHHVHTQYKGGSVLMSSALQSRPGVQANNIITVAARGTSSNAPCLRYC